VLVIGVVGTEKAIIRAVGTLTVRERVSSTGDETDSPHEFFERSWIEFPHHSAALQ
jgi:hypothetical protein